MRCHAVQRLLSLTALLSISAIAASPLSAATSTIDSAVQAVMRTHGISGMVVAIAQGKDAQFHAYGVASKQTRQPVDPDTLFELGSVSKTLTATLAALAEVRGTLALDDSPSRHLPALAGSALDGVTLRHLATHTAGGFPLQLPEQVREPKQLTAYFRDWTPSYPAGTQRNYANPSIGLLGLTTAKSLGQPYASALSGMLSELGMTHTYLDVPASAADRYAQGYNRDDQPVRLNPAPLANEAYGLKSSARDMLRFVQAQLGAVNVTDELRQAMATTRTGYYQVGPMTQGLVWEQYGYPTALQPLLEGNSSRMALESQPAKAIEPPLAPQADAWINKTGSTNGFGAYLAFIPARQLGIVILANRFYPNEARVRLAYEILETLD